MEIRTAQQAADLIRDHDTVLIGGSGGGHAVPETLIRALQQRFESQGSPRGLTLVHPVGLGDMDTQGVSRLAQPGLLKRIVTGALVNTPPIQAMAQRGEVEAYTLPQGVLSQLTRDMAAGRPGLITHVGLHTFVDPRYGGGRQSATATEDLVELIEMGGQEWLFYPSFKVDVALLRGTTIDEDGNVTMEHEAVFGEMLSMAQAAHNQGGLVVVQAARLAKRGTLHPKQVKIPGMLVDIAVIDPDQMQSYTTRYNPSFAGELRIPLSEIPALAFDARKVIARRAALELFPGAICNLGAGISTGIANLAAEEGFMEQIYLTNEQGLIGGAPASGVDAGAGMNYDAIVDQPYQFDFYDGGGLDLAFLSFAQADAQGSVNVSRFNGRVVGIGGFQNISQNAKKVIFSGTFTAGGLKISWPEGSTHIEQEGRFPKFVAELEQLSFNGRHGWQRGQQILYVTERAVFRRGENGLELLEAAPGVDLERDVFAHMEFRPPVSADFRRMDPRLFDPAPMGLAQEVAGKAALNMSPRLRETGASGGRRE